MLCHVQHGSINTCSWKMLSLSAAHLHTAIDIQQVAIAMQLHLAKCHWYAQKSFMLPVQAAEECSLLGTAQKALSL